MKKLIVCLICVILLLSAASCTPKTTPEQPSAQPSPTSSQPPAPPTGQSPAPPTGQSPPPAKVTDTIVVAYPTDPGNLAPFGTSNSFTDFILYCLYESLYKVNDATGEVVPLIMESMNISADGKEYTFQLKKGIKDTNGNEIKASDCLFSFLLCNDSPRSMDTQIIDFEKTEAVGDYTFKLVLKAPGKTYLAQFGKIYIISEKSYKDSKDQMVTTPVATGPYKLDNWVQGSTISFVANDSYWGAESDVKRLEFKIISDPSQRTTALMTGEANVVYDYLISDFNYINGTKGFTTEELSTNVVYFMGFNFSETSFGKDENFRKACCLALNNEALVTMVYRNLNIPATTCESKSCFDYTPAWEGSEFYKYDVKSAKEYLAKSGYDGSPLILITKSNVNRYDVLCEAIQNQLKQIGVIVEIQQYEPVVLSQITLQQPADWDILISDSSTFSNFAVDVLNLKHVRRNNLHLSDDIVAQFKEYTQKGISSSNPQESADNTLKAIWLNQDLCTYRAICYATFKFAHADYLSNFGRYSTNKIAWNEIIVDTVK